MKKEALLMEYLQLSKQFYKDKAGYEQLYNNRFNHEETIRIPISIYGNEAFLTHPKELIQLLTNIYKEDKKLSENVWSLQGIALDRFMKKCLVDEIELTNDIEGVYTTRKEIKDLINTVIEKKDKKRLQGLVQKYIMLSQESNIKITSCQDVRKIYDELVLQEVLEEDERNAPDGVIFRKDSVSVQGKDLQIIHYGVTPEENIISYMDECIKILNDDAINPLVIVAVVHYFIGYIHPFYDGNGRLNRFLSSYLLSKELHPLVGYSLSYTIKTQIDTYYKTFKITNDRKNKGDITPFVIIFLGFVLQSMEHLNSVLTNKIEQLSYYAEKINEEITNEKMIEILFLLLQNSLFGEEGLTVDQCAEFVNISVSTVRNYIALLPKDLLLVTKNGYRKLYDINLDYF